MINVGLATLLEGVGLAFDKQKWKNIQNSIMVVLNFAEEELKVKYRCWELKVMYVVLSHWDVAG